MSPHTLALFQMTSVFLIIFSTLILYIVEKIDMSVVSLGSLCFLLLFFHIFPVLDAQGQNVLSSHSLLAGFANPALITVLALLVMGQGLARTGVLDNLALCIHRVFAGHEGKALLFLFLIAALTSAFLNNIPVVVIFIPMVQALVQKKGASVSRYMMPLSFSAMLGGMLTLIGSSTNLLVSSSIVALGEKGLGFFSFTVPALVVAGSGFVYVLFLLPRFLPERAGYGALSEGGGGRKEFLARLSVAPGSRLESMLLSEALGSFLSEVTLLRVRDDHKVYHAPSSLPKDVRLLSGFLLIVSATRDTLAQLLAADPSLFLLQRDHTRGSSWHTEEQVLVEAIVMPHSSFVGNTLKEIKFRRRYDATAIGLEQSDMVFRRRVVDTPLRAGDVLLIQGTKRNMERIKSRQTQDLLLMEWSAQDVARPHHTKRALFIFLGVITVAGMGLVSIPIAALCGSVLMILSRTLPLRAALSALDAQIIFVISTAMALGLAMEKTGGALFLTHKFLALFHGQPTTYVLSGFFLLVALMANILSTKATAVLCAPIAVEIARTLGTSVEPFAVAVVFAANCSFASPVGYQTNILVIVPGHYRFTDFLKLGAPLTLLCWLTFSVFAPFWYGL